MCCLNGDVRNTDNPLHLDQVTRDYRSDTRLSACDLVMVPSYPPAIPVRGALGGDSEAFVKRLDDIQRRSHNDERNGYD